MANRVDAPPIQVRQQFHDSGLTRATITPTGLRRQRAKNLPFAVTEMPAWCGCVAPARARPCAGLSRAEPPRGVSALAGFDPWCHAQGCRLPEASRRAAMVSRHSRSDRSAHPSSAGPAALIRTASWRLFGDASAARGEPGSRPSSCRS